MVLDGYGIDLDFDLYKGNHRPIRAGGIYKYVSIAALSVEVFTVWNISVLSRSFNPR
jgi:hypothetical protein